MTQSAAPRALLSVYDKTGIVAFARRLAELGFEILSTGGTAQLLIDAGVPVLHVQDVTGFPEMLDGRVKTLHPAVHGGLLARRDRPDHLERIAEHGIRPIDLVAINLYPFERTVASGARFEDCVEQIDIGGPAMLRSAAKNHASVVAIADPADYDVVLREIEEHGQCGEHTRRRLAAKVYAVTARYDAAIAAWLGGTVDDADETPAHLLISAERVMPMRYGENPHQRAALYGGFLDEFEKLHGKELSYNNIVDIDAAAALIDEFAAPAAAIIKHTNPCGCATADTLYEAYERALSTDPTSAYGGIIAVNREVDVRLAEKLNEMFCEVIIAPAFAHDAMDVLQRKRDRRLVHRRGTGVRTAVLQVKSVRNGYLCQFGDALPVDESAWKVVTTRQPGDAELRALRFAWRVARHVKSNAIVYTNEWQTLGVGAGQMSRVDSSAIAVIKAGNAGLGLAGSVVASDAYFPFADGLIEAARAGATAVIQPGGSVRDEEVIRAADEHGLAMIFTGTRHFKH
ncbi:MAG TPA: bifunctional phosphoribosylaminoimidazolecarboxamide formyltransferase/IMP cyclohydrolase [Bacteroidota bacterium]|nr:bifunctional phosphoribosylaminoimidazolecarboxamide formyltransferase/IMP cyclohydrolase [Bacteroidota bacterium]